MKTQPKKVLVRSAPEKAHADFSASGAKIWLSCEGSYQLSMKAPPKPTSAAADEGTTAHEVLEFLIKNRKKRGAAIETLRKNKKYTEAMITHGVMALDYIESRLREHGGDLYSEIRCDLPVKHKGQFGTTDAEIAAHFDILIVFDYKYGRWAVSPDQNEQMLFYGVSEAHKYGYNFDKAELVILQPRAQVDGEWIRSWTCDMDTLRSWRKKFELGIEKSLAKNPPLNPGEWCTFCRAAPICPKNKDEGFEKAALDYDDDAPAKTLLPEVTAKNMTLKRLPEILEGCDKLERWIKAVRNHAEDVLKRGGKVSGWGLVPKRAVRVWNNEEKVIRLAKRTWTDGSAFTAPELLTPTQIEKMGVKGKTFVELHAVKLSSGVKLGKPHSNAASDYDDDDL